jgi:hypothetical protein
VNKHQSVRFVFCELTMAVLTHGSRYKSGSHLISAWSCTVCTVKGRLYRGKEANLARWSVADNESIKSGPQLS